MAKITSLPATQALTGAEHLPVVQGGATKRVTMAAFRDLITPYLQAWYKGDRGDVGEAANTFETLARMKALDPVKYPSATLADRASAPKHYAYVEGDYRGQADDIDIVELDRVALSVGALVRQTADSITVTPEAPTMKRRPLIESVHEKDLTPQMFSGTSLGINDWGQYFQDMIDWAQDNDRQIKIPAGRYPIGRTLKARKEFMMLGMGAGTDRATQLINIHPDATAPLIDVYASPGNSAISLLIADMSISTPGSYATSFQRKGTAVRLNTATGHIIAHAVVRGLIINNHSIGVDIGGVFYKNTIDNVRVSGSSVQSGLPIGPDVAGFRYGIVSYQDVTYNRTVNCEVTNIRNGGRAYWGSSQGSTWIDCTADGPFDLTSIAGAAINCTVEGWTQDAGASPVGYAMGFSRFGVASGLWLRAIPAGKVGIGVYLGGSGCHLSGLKGSDGVLPPTPIYLDGENFLSNIALEGVVNRIPATGPGGLNGSIAVNCDSVTNYGLSYRTDVSWAPDFSTWDTAPSLSAARYSLIGDEVHININANGGVIGAGDRIGGLPFPASALVGGTATLAAGDGTKSFVARVFSGNTAITGLRPGSLDGEFWQLTAIYKRAM